MGSLMKITNDWLYFLKNIGLIGGLVFLSALFIYQGTHSKKQPEREPIYMVEIHGNLAKGSVVERYRRVFMCLTHSDANKLLNEIPVNSHPKYKWPKGTRLDISTMSEDFDCNNKSFDREGNEIDCRYSCHFDSEGFAEQDVFYIPTEKTDSASGKSAHRPK